VGLSEDLLHKKPLTSGLIYAWAMPYTHCPTPERTFQNFVESLSAKKAGWMNSKLDAWWNGLQPKSSPEQPFTKGQRQLDFYSGFVYSMLDCRWSLYPDFLPFTNCRWSAIALRN
jgi:hypothetical protein